MWEVEVKEEEEYKMCDDEDGKSNSKGVELLSVKLCFSLLSSSLENIFQRVHIKSGEEPSKWEYFLYHTWDFSIQHDSIFFPSFECVSISSEKWQKTTIFFLSRRCFFDRENFFQIEFSLLYVLFVVMLRLKLGEITKFTLDSRPTQ